MACGFTEVVLVLESSVVRAFPRGAMGHRIDPSWGGPIELFLVPGPVFKVGGMWFY